MEYLKCLRRLQWGIQLQRDFQQRGFETANDLDRRIGELEITYSTTRTISGTFRISFLRSGLPLTIRKAGSNHQHGRR